MYGLSVKHKTKLMTARIIVYELNASGHCPGWMSLISRGLAATGAEVIVCCRTEHPQVAPWLPEMIAAGCRISLQSCDLERPGEHAARLAKAEGASRIFFPNFDSIVYAIGKNGAPGLFENLDIGGIWLRPTFEGVRWGSMRSTLSRLNRTRRGKLARQHQRALKNNKLGLERILDTGGLRPKRLRLFFTSPVSLAQASNHLRSDQVSLICDPWLEINHTPKQEARKMLNLPRDRTILLHAGTSRPEKGLDDLCKAIRGLPEDYASKLLLLRAGKTDSADRKHLSKLESAGLAHTLDRFISEEELQLCYTACDWVTLPYRNQSESSGILIHAAANLRPVLASDFGLIGENTRIFKLGRVFTHKDIKALSREIIRLITDQTTVQEAGMMRFSESNSPTEFVRTLRNQWRETRQT